MIEKIISGGQTGVDRAALDVAIELDIPHGGWCPKGRKAEDGVIPPLYQLQETFSSDYDKRTKLNIQDSDATLILVPAIPIKVNDGTILTIEQVCETEKLFLIINLNQEHDFDRTANWVNENNIRVLNIAGPRESQSAGIYELSLKFLRNVISRMI